MIIRKAEIKDTKQLTDIYNYEVLNGTATFDLQPKTVAEREVWLKAHNIGNHPLWVAEVEGVIAGYISLSPYREKEAYAATVELSLYVHKDHRRKGIARKLMIKMLAYARKNEDIHTVISVITEGNDGSVKLHEELGFECSGVLKAVGFKFNRYLDVINYQLMV